MKIIKIKSADRNKLLERSKVDAEGVVSVVSGIISDVKVNGDNSLKSYTEKFDGVKIEELRVSRDEIKESYKDLDKNVLKALKKAAENIKKFHKAQIPDPWFEEVAEGITAGQIIRPIEKVGCYIPGGRAVYPSSVLMTIIPAKIAGVQKVICCTPPMQDGTVNPMVLAAADIAGADEIYKVGGAQAIAAMAFGTQSVPKVDKIVGPGNIFVTAAKKLVYGYVDIDFPAGPSEVLIIADKTANSEYIAFDMLAQAEHDPDAASVLVTDSTAIAQEVNEIILANVKYMQRSKIIEESLQKYGKIIITDSIDEAVEFANEYAAEHLIITTKNDEDILNKINNAGSIFLGELTPVAAGDYGSGTNHVLPTSKNARMYSGLSTESFIKKPTVQRLSREGVKNLEDVVVTLAEYEGLYAHAESFKKRISKD
ncbi:MAG: histidinol dehydrogenase [Methanobacterium sp.]